MSRIGRVPVQIPAGVEVKINGNVVSVKGPKGELSRTIESKNITVKVEDNQVLVTRVNDEPQNKALHGLYRKLISNMVEGVTNGYSKTLVVNGVGYKTSQKGNGVVLDVGFSHPVTVAAVPGITLKADGGTKIIVSGIDKELVGQFAANIRVIRDPDPYHAYGISYEGETIARKEGKKGKK